jgi:hypothetical protein
MAIRSKELRYSGYESRMNGWLDVARSWEMAGFWLRVEDGLRLDEIRNSDLA